jgi:hypothetical protein
MASLHVCFLAVLELKEQSFPTVHLSAIFCVGPLVFTSGPTIVDRKFQNAIAFLVILTNLRVYFKVMKPLLIKRRNGPYRAGSLFVGLIVRQAEAVVIQARDTDRELSFRTKLTKDCLNASLLRHVAVAVRS